MDAEPSYSEQWRDWRKRRNIVWLIFLGYIPGVIAIFFSVLFLFRLIGLPAAWDGPAFYAIAGSWMFSFIVAGIYAGYFPCPRCHKPFFVTWWYRNPFARKCVHCGLPKWANSGIPDAN
jgi:hypothetical protein